jgi:EAL domain-containing protein (putative c-di-GMP-specific phosphodiesterase class I)
MLRLYGSVGKKTRHILEHCEFGLSASKEHYGIIVDTDKMDREEIQSYAEKFSFGQHLRLAFLDKRIYPHIQPILNLRTNQIDHYEVLMRIENEDGSIMLPQEFLPTLKKMYLFPEVTKYIIQKSFELFEKHPYDFSINITYADIVDESIRTFIATLIKENPQTARRCTFELLENEAVHNLDEVNNFFAFLHRNGLKIALDDFGTGYANYDTILQLDIDMIKIDGSLINSMASDHKSRIIVESIVAIARTSNAKVVAEWVRDAEILALVKEIGIDYAQGFHIGKPAIDFIEALWEDTDAPA